VAGALRPAEPGGSRRLAGLIERYGEAIEADLAFRGGWDLGELWRRRRWRFLLNLIEHLPRDSAFAEAVASDDELAQSRVEQGDLPGAAGPSIADYTPVVEAIAALYDRVGQLIVVTAAAAGAKKPPNPKPYPRPVTALDRARRRASRAVISDIVAKATPHALGRGGGGPAA
jgi:hypothetical protein